MNEDEVNRRLAALEEATAEMNCAEVDYQWKGEHAREPFRGWPVDGDITVVYGANGNVTKLLYVGSAPDEDQMRIIIDVTNELIAKHLPK